MLSQGSGRRIVRTASTSTSIIAIVLLGLCTANAQTDWTPGRLPGPWANGQQIVDHPTLEPTTDWLGESVILPDSRAADLGLNTVVRGQSDGGGADPSDPTQVTFHLMQEVEWTKLSQGQGDMVAYKLSPFIPLNIAEQSFLFNVEVPMTYAGTDVLGHHTGLGDTRMKLFWLIGTEAEFVRAIVPSFDAIAPTGDSDKGLGGGSWVLMPNMVFALQAAENLSIYPFFRYVHADAPRPFFLPDSGIPIPPDADPEDVSADTRAFNMEVMITFGLQNAVMDWISVTPDYFQNLTGDRGYTFQMKYDTGVGLSESMFLIFKFWHPVAGDIANDFTIGLALDWYPKPGLFGRCCRRLRPDP